MRSETGYGTTGSAESNDIIEVVAKIVGVVCALCGLYFGLREGGFWGGIIGFCLGGIGGVIATYFAVGAIIAVLVLAGLGAVVWILGHFF